MMYLIAMGMSILGFVLSITMGSPLWMKVICGIIMVMVCGAPFVSALKSALED